MAHLKKKKYTLNCMQLLADYHTDKIQWQISIYATSYGTHNRCIGGTNNKEKFFFCSKFSISAGALFR